MKRQRIQSTTSEIPAKAAKTEDANILTLPDACLEHIMSFLALGDGIKLGAIDKRVYALAQKHPFRANKCTVDKGFQAKQLWMYKEMGKRATELRLDLVSEDDLPQIMPCFPKITALALNTVIKKANSAKYFLLPLVKFEDGWESDISTEFLEIVMKHVSPTLRVLHGIKCDVWNFPFHFMEKPQIVDFAWNGDSDAMGGICVEFTDTLERLTMTNMRKPKSGDCPGCQTVYEKHSLGKHMSSSPFMTWRQSVEENWHCMSFMKNLKFLRCDPKTVFKKLAPRDKKRGTVFWPKLEEAVLTGYMKNDFFKVFPETLKKLTLEGETNTKLTKRVLERFPNVTFEKAT